ncbi:MAG: hypothetical protein ACOZAJ_01535, partial [Patescibacteria group bacterium]
IILKKVEACLVPGYLLSWQLKIASWLVENYGLSWPVALNQFVYFKPNRNFKIDKDLSYLKTNSGLVVSSGQLISNLVYSSLAGLEKAIDGLLSREVSKNRQILFLVPTQNRLDWWLDKLKDKFPVVAFSSSSSLSFGRSLWLKLRQKDNCLVIGSRLALFLPFNNLGGIIIDQSANENYRQSDQFPRYDPVVLAKQIALINNVNCLQLSAAPRLESWQAARLNQEKFKVLKDSLPRLEVIDMTADRQAGHKGLLAEVCLKQMETSLKSGKNVFVYLNRLGEATAAICQDCGYSPVCSNCQRNLVSRLGKSNLYCYHCSKEQDYPLPCPGCSGNNFLMRGTGLDKLYNWLVGLRPDWVLFKDSLPAGLNNSPFVLVGGQAAWQKCRAGDFGLIVLVNPDGEMSLPEFRAPERLWHRLYEFLSSGVDKVMAQTYRLNSNIWQSFSKSIDKRTYFYEREIKERFKYQYPPFSGLLRLTWARSEEKVALAEARFLKNKLRNFLSENFSLIGPYPDYYKQLRGKYRWHLLIKAKSSNDFKTIWPLLPDDVIIDIDPENILS